jgi:Zn-finger nucleic acid-binding protein
MTKPGFDLDGLAQTEADHFEKCPNCGQWVDRRDLTEVLKHIHDGDEIEFVRGPRPRRPLN